VPPAHFFLQDKSGKSLVVEPVDGTLKVHDAPLGVMANAPTYDWHMTNLANYINLSVNDIESIKLGAQKISAFGAGGGLLGLPGDFTPPSRFARDGRNQAADRRCLVRHHDAQGCLTISKKGTSGAER
jgi:choloylglycine hydrolase